MMHVIKGWEIKTTVKFRALRRFRFEDTKRIMSPEMCPKSFWTFVKRAPDPHDELERLWGLTRVGL